VTTAPNGDDINDVAATIMQRDPQTRIDAGH